MMTRSIATYSMLSTFRDCRRKAQLRYVDNLVPLRTEHSLSFGSQVHRFLETWHRDRDLARTLDLVDEVYAGRDQDFDQKRDWLIARALVKSYSETYSEERLEILALEQVFRGPIRNPATGAISRTFSIGGRIDGLVRLDGEVHVLERKTVARIDGGYLEQLWGNTQTVLYAHYAREILGYPIKGIVYDLIEKPRLQQSLGETEAEFEARREALIAKSKSGTTSAKRRLPESDEEFSERLLAWFREPGHFHRERILVDEGDIREVREETWELLAAFREARRRGSFYRNPNNCYRWNRPCPYFELCRSRGNPSVIENFYERRPPHEELEDTAETDESERAASF